MPDTPKSDDARYWFMSATATTVIYLVLWLVAMRVHISGQLDLDPVQEEAPRQIVGSIDVTKLDIAKPEPTLDPIRELTFEQSNALSKILPRPQTPTLKKPDLKPVRVGVGRDLLEKPPEMSTPTAAQAEIPSIPDIPNELSEPPPAIMAIDAGTLPAVNRELDSRTMVPTVKRTEFGGGLLPTLNGPGAPGKSGVPGSPGSPQAIPLQMRMNLPRTRPPVLDPDKMPPLSIPTVADIAPDATQDSEYGNLDDLLSVQVRVYHDPEDGGGYFEITIRPNESNDRLKPIPHDVLFLLDCSASMTEDKLREFKKALTSFLPVLDPQDRFNVVVFRDKSKTLFDDWQKPTPDAMQKALAYIDRQTSVGRTDVYAGLAPFVTLDRSAEDRPYLIYLVTDGKTTTGDNLENNEFIRLITRENRSNAAIFALSGGARTNQFLLEFLSYNNQGVSLYMPEMESVPNRTQAFMSQLSQIIVANPECSVTGNLNDDLFPRRLPHLFRQYPLRIYGRFPRGTDEIAFQVLGTSNQGKREELLVRQNLNDATPAGPEIAKSWAGQKIYYLTSEWIRTRDPDTRKEIYRLGERYNLVVPY